MKLRILVVEDNPVHYENLVSIIKGIPSKDEESNWGIDDFEFNQAKSLSEAESLLRGRKNSPHIMVLDLKIPRRVGGIPKASNGFKTLNLARKLRAADQIMIYTNYQTKKNLLQALREGANDFIEKPTEPGVDDQDLQTRFIGCWRRVLENESTSLFEQRIKDLIPYAEAGLAHRFTACFSDFVQTVAHTAEDIENYAHERFGIDREKDSQDYLIRCLKKQEVELKVAQENWAGLKADLFGSEEKPKTETLSTMLDSIEENLSPCRLVKRTSISKAFNGDAETRVLSFQDDVRVVLQELISGALSTLPDYGDKHDIDISIRSRNGQAEIQVIDNLEEKVSSDDAQAINGGFSIGPDHGAKRFGRVWGLSVVQHIALRGGGRLIVGSPSLGNAVTYFVPLAQ